MIITKEQYDQAKSLVADYEKQERNRKELEAKTIDKGLGKCREKHCNNFATTDYNGHSYFVCESCDDKLNREFEDEYN